MLHKKHSLYSPRKTLQPIKINILEILAKKIYQQEGPRFFSHKNTKD